MFSCHGFYVAWDGSQVLVLQSLRLVMQASVKDQLEEMDRMESDGVEMDLEFEMQMDVMAR